MLSMEIIGTWLAAGLTLFIFSFLYKDNPYYKFAEHLYVGISAGYWVSLQYHNVFRPNLWDPLIRGDLMLLIPFALGILLFTRFTKNLFWLSRWALALIIGIFAGIAIIGYGTGDLIQQIHANILPLWKENLFNNFRFFSIYYPLMDLTGWLWQIGNLLLFVGVLTSLIYFFFSKEHKGAVGAGAKIGIWFLMISFGASFGYTVMSRMSLLIGRVYFLLEEWLGLIS